MGSRFEGLSHSQWTIIENDGSEAMELEVDIPHEKRPRAEENSHKVQLRAKVAAGHLVVF